MFLEVHGLMWYNLQNRVERQVVLIYRDVKLFMFICVLLFSTCLYVSYYFPLHGTCYTMDSQN